MVDRPRQRGFALLTVLFGLAIVTVLISASLSRTIAHVQITKAATKELEARARFEGAVEIAGRMLAESGGVMPQEPVSIEIGGESMTVEIRDVHSLVDVNTAREDVLAALFDGHGEDGAAIAKQIVAKRVPARSWTSPEELVRLGVVSPRVYQQAQKKMTVWSGKLEPAETNRAVRLVAVSLDSGIASDQAVVRQSAASATRLN